MRRISVVAATALLISPWTITEFSSALALKERVGTISHQERRAALAMFEKFRGLRLELVAMEAADFEAAAKLCDASGAPLRAGDALHLAVCRRVRGSLAGIQPGGGAGGGADPGLRTCRQSPARCTTVSKQARAIELEL